MARSGRELEQLVATLEQVLRPAGCVVTSPDHIRDVVTGQLREVDVSIRPTEGVAAEVVFECRDRSSVPDVTWVEQVLGKIQDLEGKPRAVLVSTSGFSEPALTKASVYDVDVRFMTQISADTIQSWFVAQAVDLITTNIGIVGIEITLQDATADFAPRVHDAIRTRGADAQIFHRANPSSLSPQHFLNEWLKKHRERVRAALDEANGSIERPIVFTFEDPKNCVSVDTDHGRVPVTRIVLRVRADRKRESVPPSQISTYREQAALLAENVVFNLGVGTLSLHKVTATGEIQGRFHRRDP